MADWLSSTFGGAPTAPPDPAISASFLGASVYTPPNPSAAILGAPASMAPWAAPTPATQYAAGPATTFLSGINMLPGQVGQASDVSFYRAAYLGDPSLDVNYAAALRGGYTAANLLANAQRIETAGQTLGLDILGVAGPRAGVDPQLPTTAALGLPPVLVLGGLLAFAAHRRRHGRRRA